MEILNSFSTSWEYFDFASSKIIFKYPHEVLFFYYYLYLNDELNYACICSGYQMIYWRTDV